MYICVNKLLIKFTILMKTLLSVAFLLSFSFIQSQEIEPSYEVEGDKVKATYYFADGKVYKQGFFKNKKLAGKWSEFDNKGTIVSTGFYKDGKKVGTWFQWNKNNLRQINYENNSIVTVNTWKEDTKLAVNR